jgi:hypothetical protein
VSVISDDGIIRFVRYWLAKREGRRFPSRASIDPLEFDYVLGDVALIDAQRLPPGAPLRWQFRYRLVGTNLVMRDGYDLTGKTLEDLPEPEYREQIRETWTKVCETGEPVHRLRDFRLDNRIRRYEAVILPLASDGERVDMLVSVQRHLRVP